MKQGKKHKGLLLVCALAAFVSEMKEGVALELTAPFVLESTQVLPAGVRNPRFLNFFMSVESKFDRGGVSQPLGSPLNRVVRWNDIIRLETDETRKSMLGALVQRAHVDPNGGPGNTTGQVNSFLDAKVPVLAMGLTKRFTVGLAVPVLSFSVSADSGFSKSEDGQAFAKHLCSVNVVECNSVAERLNNAVNEKLKKLGYKPVGSKRVSNVGDIQLVGKYLLYEDSDQFISVKSTVIFPTGISPNPDDPIDLPTGEGRFQWGNLVAYDRIFAEDYRLNFYGGFTALLPNKMEKRIPEFENDPLSPNKEMLTRKLGGVVSMGTSLLRSFASLGIRAGAGYTFQYQTQPRYSGGSQFSQERYSFLEDLTPAQVLHSATLVAGFSSVEWYQQKKFFYPMQANLIYSHPVFGRNVATSDVISGEVVLFF